MILSQDLLETLGIIINFNDHTMMWEEATIPTMHGSIPALQAADAYYDKICFTNIENEVTARMTRILDAKYKKADLAEVDAKREQLTDEEQSKLLVALCRYETIFDGGLGLWKTTPVKKNEIHFYSGLET